MASLAPLEGDLVYNKVSKDKFKSYFVNPKAKKGRPPKKKRGRPKKTQVQNKSQTRIKASKNKEIDLVPPKKQKLDGLDARLRGAVESTKRYQRSHVIRTNWDTEKYSNLRDRIATSWTERNDLYVKGESFARFCVRCGISRNVLKRYLDKQKQNAEGVSTRGRGRPALLDRSIMVHLCEGNIYF